MKNLSEIIFFYTEEQNELNRNKFFGVEVCDSPNASCCASLPTYILPPIRSGDVAKLTSFRTARLFITNPLL